MNKTLKIILSIVIFLLLTSSVSAVGKPSITPGQGKLRACQAKENSINKRLTSLNNLVVNMESKFDSIANRVEIYYTTKVIPSGKTVSNYNFLVADIQTKKTAVQTALTKAQAVPALLRVQVTIPRHC